MSKKAKTTTKKNKVIHPNKKIFKEAIAKGNEQLLTFLLDNFKSLSRNNIKKLLGNQQILVNGASIRQFDFVLAKGDVVSISPYKVKKDGKRISKIKVIYEDDEFIVVNKPNGLLTVASDKEKELTAYKIMMDYVQEANSKNRIFVCHRLDKETSGVLIFTKTEKLKDELQNSWNDLVKTREYIAICEGIFEKKEGTKISYLLPTKTNLMFSSHKPNDGQKAITHYQVISELEDLSILKVKIDTGRKNQIRVHMKDLGHNVVGDEKYGSHLDPLGRLGLHARILEFDHPSCNKHYKFIAETPKEFLNLFGLKKIK